MANRWKLTERDREQFKPILQNYLFMLEHLTAEKIETMPNEDFVLDLSDTTINPMKLKDLLKELGYEEDNSYDNGWQLDFWIHMKRKDGKTFDSTCEELCISGCGMTFELQICPYEFM